MGNKQFLTYRRNTANIETTNYMSDYGYEINVPPTWRDLYAGRKKLLRQGGGCIGGAWAVGD